MILTTPGAHCSVHPLPSLLTASSTHFGTESCRRGTAVRAVSRCATAHNAPAASSTPPVPLCQRMRSKILYGTVPRLRYLAFLGNKCCPSWKLRCGTSNCDYVLVSSITGDADEVFQRPAPLRSDIRGVRRSHWTSCRDYVQTCTDTARLFVVCWCLLAERLKTAESWSSRTTPGGHVDPPCSSHVMTTVAEDDGTSPV